MNKHAIMFEKGGLTLALSPLSSDVITPVYFIAGIEYVKVPSPVWYVVRDFDTSGCGVWTWHG